MVVREMPTASGEWAKAGAQKLARKAARESASTPVPAGGGRTMPSWLPGMAKMGRGIVAVGVVELVEVVLVLAEAVDDVAEVVEELGTACGRFAGEVGDQLVDHFVLGLGALGGAGVSGTVEDDLSGGLNGGYG